MSGASPPPSTVPICLPTDTPLNRTRVSNSSAKKLPSGPNIIGWIRPTAMVIAAVTSSVSFVAISRKNG